VAKRISISEYWLQGGSAPLIDVRSPGEFEQGHIPGAVNIPLFDNAERVEIGTLYKQAGREAAVMRGLELTGPKMAGFVREARKLASPRIVAHCWRGGMRSESMAWLWQTAGLEVEVLEGGYKAYRQQVLSELAKPLRLRILGGKTGSGKTAVLREMAAMGGQVIDLEALAHHKGSAFGSLGQQPQPSPEQFENDLHHALRRLDPGQPIWAEDESHSIGRVYIPLPFWRQMLEAPVLAIETPLEDRIAHLVEEYGAFPREGLQQSLDRIQKRLGGQAHTLASDALNRGDLAEVARISLAYYDKTYQYALQRRSENQVQWLRFDAQDPSAIARFLLHYTAEPHEQR
jgi:tRNA 2-selenouridine synthase